MTRYAAKLELRPFVSAFLNQQLLPRLGKSSDRLAALEKALGGLNPSDQETLRFRIGRATKWHSRAKTFLPIIRKFMG